MSVLSEIISFVNRIVFKPFNLILIRPLVNKCNDVELLFDVYEKTDYTRTMTLNLICNEILQNKLKGNIAEVGVFQGKFSRLMSMALPNKKIYLFDTFQGFDESFFNTDFEKEIKEKSLNQFNNTSLELVLGSMPYRQNCLIRKGYFPETILKEDMTDLYCLVSLDCDLYKPIYAGLEFFYPRMEKGGYILVHDYNNAAYKDCKTAVKEFCKKNNVSIVPISDGWGTAIICI